MRKTASKLEDLRVADVVRREVVTVSANSTMSAACRVLLSHAISGAPVVDERGKCVGVISFTDFVKLDPAAGEDFLLQRDVDSGLLHIEQARQGYVRQYMTTAVQCIDPEHSLSDAARCMYEEQIHRLIVLDEAVCPVGVMTALDIVGALLENIESEPVSSI